MDILRDLLQSLLILGVMLVLLESLLPQSAYRPYLKMVGGLLIMLAVLQAAGGLMGRDWELNLPSEKPLRSWERILSDGAALSAQNSEQATAAYQANLEQQVQALLANSTYLLEIQAVQSQIKPDSGQIQSLTLVLAPKAEAAIAPIQIQLEEAKSELSPAERAEAKSLAEQTAAFYSLSQGAVQIEWRD